jgi:hypothetical protein
MLPAPFGAGGHNNTEINPVFRGMARHVATAARFQPKENL